MIKAVGDGMIGRLLTVSKEISSVDNEMMRSQSPYITADRKIERHENQSKQGCSWCR
jgi:hypothetical protein